MINWMFSVVALGTPIAQSSSNDNCTPVAYAKMKPPHYPPEGIRDHLEGKVVLRVTVGIDGVPHNILVETTSGSPYLDAAAADSAREWRFEPARCGDRVSDSPVLVPVNFSLADLDADPNSIIAPSWDVAADSEPMEFQSVEKAMPYFKQRTDLIEMPIQSSENHAFNEKDGSKIWFVGKDRYVGWTTVVRWRQEKRGTTRYGLYAYLCDGPTGYCSEMLQQIVAYSKEHPMPPPPPSPRQISTPAK